MDTMDRVQCGSWLGNVYTVSTFSELRMTKSATLTIQKWGNSLAVRLPAGIARTAHLAEGQLVELRADEAGVTVTAVGERRLTLTEKLALFDPEHHGGEAMSSARTGEEEM